MDPWCPLNEDSILQRLLTLTSRITSSGEFLKISEKIPDLKLTETRVEELVVVLEQEARASEAWRAQYSREAVEEASKEGRRIDTLQADQQVADIFGKIVNGIFLTMFHKFN